MPEWFKWFLIPVLIAIITSVAAVFGPTFADKIFNSSQLSYSIIESPSLDIEQGKKSIFSFEVHNDGRNKLTNIFIEIDAPSAVIEDYSINGNNVVGIENNLNEIKDSMRILVPALFKDESISVAILFEGEEEFVPGFVVKSDQVVGEFINLDGNLEEEFAQRLLSLFPSTLAALLSLLILPYMFVRAGISPLFPGSLKTWYSRKERILFSSEYFVDFTSIGIKQSELVELSNVSYSQLLAAKAASGTITKISAAKAILASSLGSISPSSLDTMIKTIKSLLDLNDVQLNSIRTFRKKMIPLDCEIAPKFQELSTFLDDLVS